jgi:hypothetical protein
MFFREWAFFIVDAEMRMGVGVVRRVMLSQKSCLIPRP